MKKIHSLSTFTHQYKVTKTLRFSLIPQGKTAAHIHEKGLIQEDEQRAADYQTMKAILDDYHRAFIEEVLSQRVFEGDEIKAAYDAFIHVRTNGDDTKKKWMDIQKRLCKKMGDVFKKANEEFVAFGKTSDLLSGSKKKGDARLVQWLRKQQDPERDTKIALVKKFKGFTNYFNGFDQNRQNVYAGENKHTSIAHRVICENMVRYFENCRNYQEITSKRGRELLSAWEGIFVPEKFAECLSQKQVEAYNHAIGAESDLKESIKGVNQTLNEYRQKMNLTARDLPMMKPLYKQILSDREASQFDDEIKSDAACADAVRSFWVQIQKPLMDFVNSVCSDLDPLSLRDIYITHVSLNAISVSVFGDYGIIRCALEQCAKEWYAKEKERTAYLNQDAFSLGEIDHALIEYAKINETVRYSTSDLIAYFCESKKLVTIACDAAKPLSELGEHFGRGQHREESIERIKKFLDCIGDVLQRLKPFYLKKNFKPIEGLASSSGFYVKFESGYEQFAGYYALYNRIRNYATRKNFSEEKIKLNFNSVTLLNGWDLNKEDSNLSMLFTREGRYYLGIMDKSKNRIFDYQVGEEDKNATRERKLALGAEILAKKGEAAYQKMVYKLLPRPLLMLPKVFFTTKGLASYPASADILKIHKSGSYKTNAADLCAYLRHYMDCIAKHEWGRIYTFNFKAPEAYTSFDAFLEDIEKASYKITFDAIRATYVDAQVENGSLYLFEIYSKDFSSFSHGKPNLHTLYWRALFDENNLHDLVIKLNGECEVFWRKASIDASERVVHTKNQPVDNKNPLNAKRSSCFAYDLVKDRRYTKDQFLFHCPITLNVREDSEPYAKSFNEKVNQFLRGNPEINVLGIDRGERNLLYYSIISQTGRIIKQGSFNVLESDLGHRVDYHDLLDRKEKGRDEARQAWKSIENIKELKAGFLSGVVHQLAQMMVQHNAVIVLEDLNLGFKRGRFKFEKQVYQKFEKALIDKLNYLVFKERVVGEAGHYLNAYQLTAGFESFEKLGKQSGILFYVPANNTSKIDPVTGFINTLYPKYANREKAQAFFSAFDHIRFNPDEDYFEFTFSLEAFTSDKNDDALQCRQWTVCSFGDRTVYEKTGQGTFGTTRRVQVTDELKTLFSCAHIAFCDGHDIKDEICRQADADFFRQLIHWLSVILALRYTYQDDGKDIDYILSPVKRNGRFFDSRQACEDQPCDADANGAYNIARKGLYLIRNISDDGRLPKLNRQAWLNFAQY